MGYEIDFLPVGNGQKSGDAIAARWGTEGNYKVIVIDGGTKESGQSLVNHIKKYYQTENVDYVVNTHPDMDHASGLTIVLEQLSVGELWMHKPWDYSGEILESIKDGRITENSLAQKLQESFKTAYSLFQLAEAKKIQVKEPFQGDKIGDFIVLSPDKELYKSLITESDKSPETKESLLEKASSFTKKVINFIKSQWDKDNLSEDVSTSEINETSVILYGNFDNKGVLLNGDSGIRALTCASDFAKSNGINLNECKFIQVPHHGSRNNVSPSILNQIVGDIVEQGTAPTKSAFISASEKDPDHPRNSVINAFTRRGVKVFKTEGQKKWHHNDMPDRSDFHSVEPIGFLEEEED